MRYLFAVLIGLHGVAHLVGFAVAWQILAFPELHYKTTVLGGLVDIGHAGTQLLGALWLATALSCVIAGSAIWEGATWSVPFAMAVTLFSLTLCLTALPEARIGVLMNVAVLAILLVSRLASVPGLS